MSVEPNDHVK